MVSVVLVVSSKYWKLSYFERGRFQNFVFVSHGDVASSVKNKAPPSLKQSGDENTDKHKQLLGIVLGMGGVKFIYVLPFSKGQKKHINFFKINSLAPTQDRPILGPRKKFMCLISWERTQKRHININFLGAFWGSKTGSPDGPFGPQKV